jgi:hypothetical protein
MRMVVGDHGAFDRSHFKFRQNLKLPTILDGVSYPNIFCYLLIFSYLPNTFLNTWSWSLVISLTLFMCFITCKLGTLIQLVMSGNLSAFASYLIHAFI